MPSLAQILFCCEWLGAVLGLLAVYLLSKGDGRGWMLGAVMIVLTGVVFLAHDIRGSAALQVFFLVTQLMGWWRWKQGQEEDLRVSSRALSRPQGVALVVLCALAWFALGWALQASGGSCPWLDSFATSLSVAAQTLMVLGIRECWLLWMAVNIAYVGLNFEYQLYAFTALYLVFFAMAVNGWREWTRDQGPRGMKEN